MLTLFHVRLFSFCSTDAVAGTYRADRPRIARVRALVCLALRFAQWELVDAYLCWRTSFPHQFG